MSESEDSTPPSSTGARIRNALDAFVEPIEPAPQAWNRIVVRIDEGAGKRGGVSSSRMLRPLAAAAAVVVAVVALSATVVLLGRQDQALDVVTSPATALPPANGLPGSARDSVARPGRGEERPSSSTTAPEASTIPPVVTGTASPLPSGCPQQGVDPCPPDLIECPPIARQLGAIAAQGSGLGPTTDDLPPPVRTQLLRFAEDVGYCRLPSLPKGRDLLVNSPYYADVWRVLTGAPYRNAEGWYVWGDEAGASSCHAVTLSVDPEGANVRTWVNPTATLCLDVTTVAPPPTGGLAADLCPDSARQLAATLTRGVRPPGSEGLDAPELQVFMRLAAQVADCKMPFARLAPDQEQAVRQFYAEAATMMLRPSTTDADGRRHWGSQDPRTCTPVGLSMQPGAAGPVYTWRIGQSYLGGVAGSDALEEVAELKLGTEPSCPGATIYQPL